jgi:hypothetical protein
LIAILAKGFSQEARQKNNAPFLFMKVKIIKTNWFLGKEPDEGTVTFETENGFVLEAFAYGEKFTAGEISEVEVSFLDAPMDWNTIFSENAEKQCRLVRLKEEWSYGGYGRVISLNPVRVDFGPIILETGYWTNDLKVVGEYIYWKIDRLDISSSNRT